VLASGAVICDGDPGSVMGDQTVRDTYLGSDIGEEVDHAAH